MMKTVGYLLLFLTIETAVALVPVEGVLLGEADVEFQQDPLQFIFGTVYEQDSSEAKSKAQLYSGTYVLGDLLQKSCGQFKASSYSDSWREKQARRSIVATLQYIGLDTSIKAIGSYAKEMGLNEVEFLKLTNNLVQNNCSKNLSVMSLRNIRSSLKHYYHNPLNMIPSVKNSPYVTELFVQNTESPEARSRQFDQTIKNFRSFCSWGGDTEDYRLLPPYLSNPFIMSFVFRNLEGLQLQVSNQSQGLELIPSRNTVQVSCKELICRKTEKQSFNENFPLSIGSSGLAQDLAKLYCHHFRYQNYSANKAPVEIREWIKKMELEDPILETNNFISLMTGVPDPLLGIKEYQEIPFIAKSSIDKRWNAWSEKVLSTFSNDLLYEESFKVRAVPRRDTAKLRTEGFLLDFTVTLGEMDRLMDDTDKLDLTFNLKLSKNYLRQIRRKWQLLSDEVDTEGQKLFKKEMARYINQNLSYKEKLFTQKMWNEDFSRLIADELLGQVLAYRGPLFDSYKEEMLRVPIRFSYGLFALSYLRYRADTSKGHLKLNL